ncbi:hypothetical protein Zmor_003400 [Zophobas morio]|uniref:Uncharacterized protein n=1 Tax=Zophobas morio TaxID=2755281 RepID=A0AA38HLI4_9CUCU|nr:hypothetical protein Zmor_003400 [Zophobas morio]
MTSEYVLRKNRKKGGKSTRGPPGIGFNLTENGDYDISGHKLVNVKQPENPGDAVNLQYLTSASTKWNSAREALVHEMDTLHAAVDKVNDNMIKKDDSQSILKIVKPEMDNMIKKDDSESVLKIVKPELSNMITKDSLNLTATRRYIDIGNRRLVKTANAIDKYDVVNKGQLDDTLTNYGHYSFLQFVGKIRFIKEVDGQKTVTVLFLYFDGERFIRLPMDVEVVKFYSTANLKDLNISNNKGTIDVSKPFIVRESDLLSFMIKKEKVNTDENLGGYNHNKPYLLSIPIFFYMLVKFSV